MFTTSMLLTLLSFSAVAADSPKPNACNGLTGEKKTLADTILRSEHPYRCCDETIEQCLHKKNPCALAVRLANRVCTLVNKGETESKIRKRLKKRAESTNPNQPKATINLKDSVPAGQSSAPLKVVVYACARCPYCGRLVPQLHREVTTGRLKGHVQLYFKPFPLKSHELSTEGGLALVSAATLGKFWDFAILMYRNYSQFNIDKLADWAAEAGMDKNDFSKTMASPQTRTTLVNSKKEGLANGVKATPQIFINGRKYTGFLDLEELVDTMLGETVP